MKRILLFVFLIFVVRIQAQIITTFAGNGNGGNSGNGLPAKFAPIDLPSALVFDTLGNLYIANMADCIRKVNTSGIISTFAGTGVQGFSGDNGPATSAKLYDVSGLIFDSIGNLLICDAGNSRLRKVDTLGIITTISGNGTQINSGDGGQASAASIVGPGAVIIDSIGNIYLGCGSRIRKIDTSGIITTIAGTGTSGYSGDGGLAISAQVDGVSGFAFDTQGNLYFSDHDNNRIRMINKSGIITTIVGNGTYGFSGDGGQAISAELAYPGNIKFDKNGNLFIADGHNVRVRKVNNLGIINTIAGGGPNYPGDGGLATDASFTMGVSGIDFDVNGNLYLGEWGMRVHKVTPPLLITVNSGSICAVGTVTLTANGATTYSWSPASGLSATTGSSVVANPSVTTTYTVVGTTGDSMGLATSAVTVNSISVNSPTLCAGTGTLTANGASTYSWSPSTNLSSTTGSVVVASPTATTIYTVTGVIGSCTLTATSTVTVNSIPTLTLTGSSYSICKGSSQTFTVSGASSYSWTPATALSGGSTANPTANPTTSIVYSVKGTSGGCVSSPVTLTLSVISNPALSVSNFSICPGGTATLTATGADTYTWNTSETGSTITPSPTVTTNYTVTGTDTTTTCANTKTVTVTVSSTPSITATGNSVCYGGTATISASGASTYTWNTGATSPTITVTPSVTTHYTVTGNSSGCPSTATATTSVTVVSNPTVTLNGGNICTGGSVTLTAAGASSYTWSTGANGSSIAVSPTVTTTYSVIGKTGTCTATVSNSVSVNSLPNISVNSPTICAGNTATLTATGASTYTWNTGTTGSTITPSPTVSTTYNVTGAVSHTSAIGITATCTSSATSTVSIGTLTSISVNSPTIIVGDTAILTASGASTYTWSNGVTGNPIKVAPITTTVYTVNATAGTCTGVATSTVTTTNNATLTYSCTGNPQTFVVPFCVDSIYVEAWGAGGGGGGFDTYGARSGGGGAYAKSAIAVSEGQVLTIKVGCGGQPGGACVGNGPGGVGGFGLGTGGNGGNSGPNGCSGPAGGGGGGTGILNGSSILLVAAGGGGGGGGGNQSVGAPGGAGGQNGGSSTSAAGGILGASASTDGVNGTSQSNNGGGGGGGGGGLNGGGGGATAVGDDGAGGGAGGTSMGNLINAGIDSIPGNSGSPILCTGCGIGGAGSTSSSGSGSGTAGGPGLIIINYKAHAPITGTISSTAGCGIATATVTASGGTSPYTYNWSPAGGITSTASNLVSGNYSVTITDSNSCVKTITNNITTHTSPVVSFTTLETNCSSDCFSFIGSSSPTGISYTWYFGDGGNSTLQNPMYCYNNSGTYTVKLIVIDVNGCTDSVSGTVTDTCNKVWPGDADENLMVDNNDLLPIGLEYGNTGPARTSIGNNWQGYTCSDWSDTLSNGKNIKYADCNGDGTIDMNDTLAVNLNYGSTHPARYTQQIIQSGNPDIYLMFDKPQYIAGDTVNAFVYIGSNANPQTNFYGAAFNISYDVSNVQSGTERFWFNDSWIGNINQSKIKFSRINSGTGMIDASLVRITHTDTTGFGKVATLQFVLNTGLTNSEIYFTTRNAIKTNSAGNISNLNAGTDSAQIVSGSTNVQQIIGDKDLIVYPNPANDQITLQSSIPLGTILIYNSLGEIILYYNTTNKKEHINISKLPGGVYTLKAGNSHLKIIKE